MKFAKLKTVFACALLIGVAQTATALPKQGAGTQCDCMCVAPSGVAPGGVIYSFNTYDPHGLSCFALEGLTCNLDNPNTGGVATGSVQGCRDKSNASRRPATIVLPTGIKIGPLRRR